MKIYKHPIYIQFPQYVKAQNFLHVGKQGSEYFVWVEDGERLFEILIVATGMSVPDNSVHIGTIVDEPYVWHVYARPE